MSFVVAFGHILGLQTEEADVDLLVLGDQAREDVPDLLVKRVLVNLSFEVELACAREHGLSLEHV